MLRYSEIINVYCLSEASYTHLSAFYDNGHRAAAIWAGEWAAVIHLGWFQRDALTASQADYP